MIRGKDPENMKWDYYYDAMEYLCAGEAVEPMEGITKGGKRWK